MDSQVDYIWCGFDGYFNSTEINVDGIFACENGYTNRMKLTRGQYTRLKNIIIGSIIRVKWTSAQ